jgi:hypothetical protein
MAVTALGIVVVPTNDAIAETPLVDKVEDAICRTKPRVAVHQGYFQWPTAHGVYPKNLVVEAWDHTSSATAMPYRTPAIAALTPGMSAPRSLPSVPTPL